MSRHEFEWRREECFLLRKPDPAVLVAVTKEPSGRLKTSSVQILDYNLNRFDIDDRKGLEIVILTALLTFQDSNEAYHAPPDPSTPSTTRSGFFGASRRPSDPSQPTLARQVSEGEAAPPLPPKPPPQTGAQRVAEMHALRAAQGEGTANEVQVADECVVEDYAEYAEMLLKDDAMLFVTIRSASAREVAKVLQVVEHTKRLRHKAGLDEDQELHQYVVYDTEKPKGPRRINLNDPALAPHLAYAPPTSLSVHLSKIDMPELKPKADATPPRPRASMGKPPPRREPPPLAIPPDSSLGKGRKSADRPLVTEKPRKSSSAEKREERDREKERLREKEREKEREKAQRKAEKDAKKSKKASSSKPEINKSSKPQLPTSGPSGFPIYQPAPSASAYQPSPTHLGYRPPPSPSFATRPQSAFYGGGTFDPYTTPPPNNLSAPRPRPTSYYGPGPYNNAGGPTTPGFHPGFLRP